MIDLEEMNRKQQKKYDRLTMIYQDSFLEGFYELRVASEEAIKETECGKAYFSIVEKAAHLLKELKPYDNLEAAKIFDYLLWNGYFSQDKDFSYSVSNRVNSPYLLGADVMRGKSVCINNASLLSLVLREYGVESYLIGADIRTSFSILKKDKNDDVNHLVIKPKLIDIVKSGLIKLTPLRKLGNHAVSIIEKDDRYYISDPTNQTVANFTDLLKVTTPLSSYKMEIKPCITVFSDKIEPERFNNMIDKSFMHSDEVVVTDEEEIFASVNANLKCGILKSLLDDFYDDVRKDIDTVSKTLVKKLVTDKDIKRHKI